MGLQSWGQVQGQAAIIAQLKSWHKLTIGETAALESKTAIALSDYGGVTWTD